MPRGTWVRSGSAIAGFALAGLVLAGCAHQPTTRRRASVASCTAFSVRALRRYVTVTSVSAACRGLTRAQTNKAARTALGAIVGSVHGVTRLRARVRELSPLLEHLVSAVPAQPGPAPAPAASGSSGPPARVTALLAWLATVGLGSAMMARWITRIGLRRLFTGKARSAAALNLAHFGLAVAGLLIWVGYLLTSLTALAWAGCVLLLPVAGLGMALIGRWFPDLSPAPVPTSAADAAGTAPAAVVAAPARAEPGPPKAQHPPIPVVAAHVGFAVTTILFAVLAAIGPG